MTMWVDSSGVWAPDTWLVIFAGLTFLVAAIAAFVGLRQLKANQRVADEQTRPYVQVDIESRRGLMTFDVWNMGRRPAVNVNVTLDPEPVSSNEGFQTTLRAIFNPDHITEMLAPGKRLQWFVDVSFNILGKDVPQSYMATVTYNELPTKGRKVKTYVEHHTLSFSQYGLSALPEDGLPQLVKATRDIASKIEGLQTLSQKYGIGETKRI
jgi:hypothetical protein